MIFGKGESRRTFRTSNEDLPKSAKIAAFWQGSYYSCLAYHKIMCLVILIPPLARLRKNLKAHRYFRELKRFLPFSDPSKAGQGERLRMTRMASFYCGKTRRTEIENVPCHSDLASCAA